MKLKLNLKNYQLYLRVVRLATARRVLGLVVLVLVRLVTARRVFE